MLDALLAQFPEIVVSDFEFGTADGRQQVRCLTLRELRSGRTAKYWADELGSRPPFDVERALFVGHYASAEMRCFLELGWPMPRYVIDTYVEQRRVTNGRY